jgi:hypothetical protein
MMDQLMCELNKEYRRERLREAEKERMLKQFHQGASFDLPQKILIYLRELLTNRARMNRQRPGQASRFTFHILRFISNKH